LPVEDRMTELTSLSNEKVFRIFFSAINQRNTDKQVSNDKTA